MIPSVIFPFAKVGLIDGLSDAFCITQCGLRTLVTTRGYEPGGSLVTFRLHKTPSDFCDLVFFEAMLELSLQGWVYSRQKPSRKTIAYKRGEVKVWYLADSHSVHYLHALLYATHLFDQGLQELPHGQAAAFYKTLLFFMKTAPSRVPDVLANQPHAYYKLLRKKNIKTKNDAPVTSTGRKPLVLSVDDGPGKVTRYYTIMIIKIIIVM